MFGQTIRTKLIKIVPIKTMQKMSPHMGPLMEKKKILVSPRKWQCKANKKAWFYFFNKTS